MTKGNTMNTKLGTGKVHQAIEGSKLPICGGNKAAERYRKTSAPITCSNCLKIQAEQSETVEAPEAPEPAPVTVYATKADGEEIEYAHIPNGNPERVAPFLRDALAVPHFSNIHARIAPTPGPETAQVETEEERHARYDAVRQAYTEALRSCDEREIARSGDAMAALFDYERPEHLDRYVQYRKARSARA